MVEDDDLPRPISKRQHMYVTSTADVTLFGGAAGCYTASAEYMSPTGWKKISEYDGGLVGQYNHDTGCLEFVKPLDYIKLPCSQFKRMRARGLDFILTDEHRVPYFNDHDVNKIKVITFGEVQERHTNSLTKGWTGAIKTCFKTASEGIPYSEFQLRLQVAIQADGSLKGRKVYIRFSKHRKAERLEWILGNLGIPYEKIVSSSERYLNGTAYEYRFYADLADKVFDGKYYQASQQQLEWMVDEVGHWDGSFVHNTENTTIRYSCSIKENVDFFQYALHACGYNTSIVPRYKEGSKVNWNLNATLSGKGFRRFANKDGKCPIEDYPSEDGFKYCFSVPSSFLVVRQNDKIFISGNSGKSEIGVIDFVKYVMIPNFIGIITRRTTVQLKGAGGIHRKCMRTFGKYYKYGEDFVWKDRDNKFVFYKNEIAENGKKVKTQVSEVFLKHFEHETNSEDDWQGIEGNLFLIDEATQYTPSMIEYISSRLRNPSCPEVKPHLKMTCNPDADHMLRTWVEPYLNEDGTPDRSKDGLMRYFVMQDGVAVWGDSREEVAEKTGERVEDVLSFTFISANCFDNPVLQKVNPKYVSWLRGLSGVKKQRLLFGNWIVRESTSTHFQRKWVEEIDDPPPTSEFVKICRAWDFASELPSDSNRSPDYTASAKIGKLRDGRYVVLELTRTRIRTGDWLGHVLEMAEKDGHHVDIVLPLDPNAAAKAGIQQVLVRPIIQAGYYVVYKRTNKSKLDRFRPFSAACQAEMIQFVANSGQDYWNDVYNDLNFVYKELEVFTGERKRGESGHDDKNTMSSINCFNSVKLSIRIY